MRYRVMEVEPRKKLGSPLRQNTGVTAPVRLSAPSQLHKQFMAAQAGLGNRYVQRMVARLRNQQDHKENIPPAQTNLENPQGGKRENHTGLPYRLKLGIEGLSGYSLDDVRVHYNSS